MIHETVYLSRRNLEVLLAKLNRNQRDPGSSQCEIVKHDTLHPKYPMQRVTHVKALENEEYYTDREPGVMHPCEN